MFGLFTDKQVKVVASAIHQICHAARHANRVMGPKAGVDFCSQHPFVTFHRDPSSPHDGHEFCFGRELEGFRFLVYENQDKLQAFGGGDYAGFGIATTSNYSYQVFVRQPLSSALGFHAKTLARVFVHHYGAHDTSHQMRS
jgi:hypothetical protein